MLTSERYLMGQFRQKQNPMQMTERDFANHILKFRNSLPSHIENLLASVENDGTETCAYWSILDEIKQLYPHPRDSVRKLIAIIQCAKDQHIEIARPLTYKEMTNICIIQETAQAEAEEEKAMRKYIEAYDSMSALQQTQVRGDTYRLGNLMKYGDKGVPVDINETDSNGDTVLHRAAAALQFCFSEALLELGANPCIENNEHKIPQELAKGYQELFDILDPARQG
jgi:hypothetical protein